MLFTYISDYFQQLNKPHFLVCTLFTALLIAGNFYWGWERQWVYHLPTRTQRFGGFYLIYAVAFVVPYLLYGLVSKKMEWSTGLSLLIVVAPAVFALKSSVGGWQNIIEESWPGVAGRRVNILLNWPIRLIITVSILWIIYSLFRMGATAGLNRSGAGNDLVNNTDLPSFSSALGLNLSGVNWKPYWIMLAAVIPLVTFAATQADFLHTYPKLKLLQAASGAPPTWWQALLYELAYGSDFFTIELFFRGFLVVFLSRYLGPAAILPMAVFYCSIHFGKPLLECISSYFGGILLGIFACYSQSIFGGIVVHLGLAWMMELAAWIALQWKR